MTSAPPSPPPAGPEGVSENAAKWIYGGLWAVLVQWFRVPHDPPTLPAAPGVEPDSFKPSPRFLDYLKLWFWIASIILDLALLIGWCVITAVNWPVGLALAIPALVLIILPDIVIYIALHLRYDTTWYVMTDRSLRIRRGIWIIHEVSITFENVQNVRVQQGPVQRLFGIASVIIETAGSGSGQSSGAVSNRGVIEGIANAPEIRDRITTRVRASRSAGLGDEAGPGRAWTAEHLAVLREIRDATVALPG